MDPTGVATLPGRGRDPLVIGLIGFVTRRNLIVMFLCTELMFRALRSNLVALGVT